MLDEIDEIILEGLLMDGRVSYGELAERTGVTSSTIKSRIDALVREGVIEEFTVDVCVEEVTEGPVMDAVVVFRVLPVFLDEVYSALTGCVGALSVSKTMDSTVVVHFKGSKKVFDTHLFKNMPDGVVSHRAFLVLDMEQGRGRMP